ncbi:Fe-S protein assembly co-chaperone HscB [Moraxella marmotae]|uniref:Fe-S protein assembly co-chaperone HscB n=1 Tax=Moraxella marmotae TaxID=3344520 RepID=UPI0035F421CA
MTKMTQIHFFALFGLPVDFQIDKTALKDALLSLQKQHHPDRSDASQDSLQQAALINHAYQILAHDDSRAAYLLELAGHAPDLSQSIDDWDFLDEMMDLRIALDNANSPDSLYPISQAVQKISQAQTEQFVKAYHAQHWEAADDATRKLQFLGKLLVDIDNKINQTLSQDSHDDDLYV